LENSGFHVAAPHVSRHGETCSVNEYPSGRCHVRLLFQSAQKQNLVISQTPNEIPKPYACAVTVGKCAKATAPRIFKYFLIKVWKGHIYGLAMEVSTVNYPGFASAN
jgi:hypothetical protein